jgi:hypothetical protein
MRAHGAAGLIKFFDASFSDIFTFPLLQLGHEMAPHLLNRAGVAPRVCKRAWLESELLFIHLIFYPFFVLLFLPSPDTRRFFIQNLWI